ncbi:hypothetical protein IWQ56_006460 [Coemansia nantahalensis]|nr:hypothetical protein IWQ56_006460 [Coemansia nantahalensis]
MHTHKKHKETAYATAIPTEPSITYAQWLVESAYATSSVSSEPVKYHSQPQPSSVAYKAEQPYRAETHPRMFSPEEVDEIVRDRELVLRQIIGKLALLAPSPTAVPAHSSATAAA